MTQNYLQSLLKSDGDAYQLYVDDHLHSSGSLASLSPDHRLGNITRRITLEDRSVFTSDEHAEIDTLFASHQKANRLLHHIESKLSWVVVSFVVLLLSIYIFVERGIPYFSERIAYALPVKTNKVLSDQTMKLLDDHLFKPSQLSKAQQMQITEHFKRELFPILPQKEQFHYHLNFRLLKDGNLSLPNAMALPSGEIILTDKFVQLCADTDELDAILLHEVGHIVHRDSLTTLIEGTFISVSVMIALGDLSGFADMGVGLGSLLLNMHYSRDHEARADKLAFDHMVRHSMDPLAFASIMGKMERYMQKALGEEKPLDANEYISTHPQTKGRIEMAKRYSECFKNNDISEKCLSISKKP